MSALGQILVPTAPGRSEPSVRTLTGTGVVAARTPGTAGACEWVDVVARTRQEIERICDQTGAPRELACHALDIDELARVDHHPEGAIRVVLRVPCADEGAGPEAPLRTVRSAQFSCATVS